MIPIAGEMYDGRSSRRYPATLMLINRDRLKVVHHYGEFEDEFAAVEVSGRLGNIPRSFVFAGGERFVTADNEAVDQLVRQITGNKHVSLVHQLESKSIYVVVSLIFLLLTTFYFVTVGIPKLANEAAELAPQVLVEEISAGALDAFDESFLSESEVSAETRQWLQQEFDVLSSAYADEYRFNLAFRKGKGVGPNAFALPSGDIVVTDELIVLAENGEEVLAVLAHEIGHVVHRHSLRHLFEDSMLAVLVFGITGDTSSFSQTAAALPLLLVSTSYSRDFEREADQFALALMDQYGIERQHFANILNRIEAQKDAPIDMPGFLTTHPNTSERVLRFSE